MLKDYSKNEMPKVKPRVRACVRACESDASDASDAWCFWID